jgi:hypothetical protein
LQEDVMREKAQTDANLLQLENDKKAAADGTTAAIVSGASVGTAALDGLDQALVNNINNMNELGYAAERTASKVRGVVSGTIPNRSASTPPSSYGGVGGIPPVTGLPMRDSGGPGIAGQAYMIGVPEVYVPKTGGDFIPLGGANKGGVGTTYNIQITNAKPESAENSIRKALKSLSYAGVVA